MQARDNMAFQVAIPNEKNSQTADEVSKQSRPAENWNIADGEVQ